MHVHVYTCSSNHRVFNQNNIMQWLLYCYTYALFLACVFEAESFKLNTGLSTKLNRIVFFTNCKE